MKQKSDNKVAIAPF